MKKLVLSGFLASEEIYINQLEALLLVSAQTGGTRELKQSCWLHKRALGRAAVRDPLRYDVFWSLYCAGYFLGLRVCDLKAESRGFFRKSLKLHQNCLFPLANCDVISSLK